MADCGTVIPSENLPPVSVLFSVSFAKRTIADSGASVQAVKEIVDARHMSQIIQT